MQLPADPSIHFQAISETLMQIPLQITVRGMPHSAGLDTRIRDEVAALEHFHARITSCRVTVSASSKHPQHGRGFEIDIDVRMPGHGEIVVNRQHDEDVNVALRDAFASATRQLAEIVHERRMG